ncbi:MAG: hypothetical protein KAJ03_01610 [Gammaproteobacteria bacterium]|nr:hypothetical protein [Gammaproteobacteria bacterium]
MTDVSESYLESLRDRTDFAEETLTAEQREHDITRRQRDTLQTQCEDMQSEMETETKLNNAALKPSAKVLQQEQDDEMACMAEEVMSLKSTLALEVDSHDRTKRHITGLRHARDGYKENWQDALRQRDSKANAIDDYISEIARSQDVIRKGIEKSDIVKGLNQKIEALELVEVALRTEVSKLAGYKVELESSAETQALHIQQVDAACKAAEAKVIEPRAEIEALKGGEDLWICESATGCKNDICKHRIQHTHLDWCGEGCCHEFSDCVTVNTFKECANMRGCVETYKRIIKGRRIIMSDEFDSPGLHQGYQPRANCVRQFAIMFSGKRENMQTPTTKHACKWYNVCAIASETSHACIANEGQHCVRKREIDAKHGVMQ